MFFTAAWSIFKLIWIQAPKNIFFTEAGWVEDTAGLKPQILPGKNFPIEKNK